MDITAIPTELIDQILRETVKLQEHDGVVVTYGLSQLPPNLSSEVPTTVQRYVRGPVPPYQSKWDATANIRLVCRQWHGWAAEYAFRDVYVKLWRGSERWCDLSMQRDKYPLYEMIDKPNGERVYRNPYSTLRKTQRLLEASPSAASNVRRMWFNGLYVPETDIDIVACFRSCTNLTSVSIPWTILRHGTAEDWACLLGADRPTPLESLELLAVSMSTRQAKEIGEATVRQPLLSPLVDFSKLRRLKIFGNTDIMPVCDDDLKAIARTVTNLEDFQLTCISTVTMEGVMAIVRASRKTLRVLEHSPRSDDGFWHPHPGHLSNGEHICSILTSCPKLEDLSISVPSMCPVLFSNMAVRWTGECQVRALALCGDSECRQSNKSHEELRSTLQQARRLMTARGSGYLPANLKLELFFADMIFDPHINSVHGDFQEAEMASGDSWPATKQLSRKGPYGSTGLYGKEEEGLFECIEEPELFAGLARNFVRL